MKWLIVVFWLLVSPAFAQTAASVVPSKISTVGCPGSQPSCTVSTAFVTPLGYQQITSLSGATFLTVPTGATLAVIVVETQSVRWRDDGVAPTASVGMLVAAGSALSYTGNLASLQFIQTTASATINVSYYK